MLQVPPPVEGDGRWSLGRALNAFKDDYDGLIINADNKVRYQIDLLRLASWDLARCEVDTRETVIAQGTTGDVILGNVALRSPTVIQAIDIIVDGTDDLDKFAGLTVIGGPRQAGTELDEYAVIASFARLEAPGFNTAVVRVHTSPAGYALEPLFSRLPWAARRGMPTQGRDAGNDEEFRMQGRLVLLNAATVDTRVVWLTYRLQLPSLGRRATGLPIYLPGG